MSEDTVVIKLFVDPWKREKFIFPFKENAATSCLNDKTDTYTFCDATSSSSSQWTEKTPAVSPFNCLEDKETQNNTTNPNNRKGDEKLKLLLSNFNSEQEWPLYTNVLCHWCCHSFSNTPVGLPLKYCNDKNIFYVTGCFCSFNCAMAYNNSLKSMDNKQEREHLLYHLAHKVKGTSEIIKPAHNPLCLSAFGGCMSIEDFRKNSSMMYFVNHPPMIMLPQQIEEVSEENIRVKKEDFVPLDVDRVNKYKETLKLKRTKPLHGNKNTLDNILNIKIVPRTE
jgi:hypothetical protein